MTGERRRPEPAPASLSPRIAALIAAVLFGLSVPGAKVVLDAGEIGTVTAASLLYLGSGAGILLLWGIGRFRPGAEPVAEAALERADLPWLGAAVLAGGVIAPVLLMAALRQTPASTASLLLNFEAAATGIVAFLFFHEAIGGRIWAAIGLITLGSIALSWDGAGSWGMTAGAAGVLLACICWGIDNNCTCRLSVKDPLSLVAVKGLAAGTVSLAVALLIGEPAPDPLSGVGMMVLGFFSYGLSIVFFILALRGMGAARTGAVFAAAPFLGAIFSFLLLAERPDLFFFIALPFMAAGAWLLAKETHCHRHMHALTVHDHRHRHDDLHHVHPHGPGEVPPSGEHAHLHRHEETVHEHVHTPDAHHRHGHGK